MTASAKQQWCIGIYFLWLLKRIYKTMILLFFVLEKCTTLACRHIKTILLINPPILADNGFL